MIKNDNINHLTKKSIYTIRSLDPLVQSCHLGGYESSYRTQPHQAPSHTLLPTK